MSDYIERKQVLDTFIHSQSMVDAYKSIAKLPAADVAPVKHGKWKRISHRQLYGYKCSECDAICNRKKRRLNYCPNCGAKMDGEQDV